MRLIYMTTNEQNIARFEKYINEIEVTVDSGIKLAFLGTLVSASDIKEVLTALHSSVKEAIEEAQQIVDYREQIIAQAHEDAEEIVRVRNLEISKQPIIKDAEDAAREILVLANNKAEEKMRIADSYENEVRERLYQYSDIVFGEVEQILHEKKKMVENHRVELNQVLKQQFAENQEAAEKTKQAM